MARMPKGQTQRERLAQHMDERRIDLGLRWADVADLAGLTPEGLRGVRRGDGELRGLTRRGIEDALQWSRGSVQTVLAGGEPSVVGEESVPVAGVPVTDVSDIQLSRVREAIEADPSLLEEAKLHLLNQYELLRRLSDPALTKEADRPSTEAAQRPLRAVARKRPPRRDQP